MIDIQRIEKIERMAKALLKEAVQAKRELAPLPGPAPKGARSNIRENYWRRHIKNLQ